VEALLLGEEVYYLRAGRAVFKMKQCKSDGKRETTRACATWVQVEDVVFVGDGGLVGVAVDNDVNACSRRV